MRREELIRGCGEVASAIESSGIIAIIESWMESIHGAPAVGLDGLRNETTTGLFHGFQKFSSCVDGFSAAGRVVLQILRLDPLLTANFWAALTRLDSPKPYSAAQESLSNARFARDQIPRLVALLVEGRGFSMPSSVSGETSKAHRLAILTVLAPEPGSERSTPARLIKVLESVTSLYTACAQVADLPEHSLTVLSCDSGSDKSFDFLGLAHVIDCVKEVLLSLWDKVIFFREHKASARLQLVAQALPILDQINAQAETLGLERAELLRRTVIGGATAFLETGAIIPEIEARSTYNPRQLMAPEPKLLTAPIIQIEQTSIADVSPKGGKAQGESSTATPFTAEQVRALQELLSSNRKT